MQETSQLIESISVANNACWAIGELAVKVGFSSRTFLLLPN